MILQDIFIAADVLHYPVRCCIALISALELQSSFIYHQTDELNQVEVFAFRVITHTFEPPHVISNNVAF